MKISIAFWGNILIKTKVSISNWGNRKNESVIHKLGKHLDKNESVNQ